MTSIQKLFILLITLASTYTFITADPTIEVANSDFDFGEVLPGETRNHTFVVKNKGNQELNLTEITPSCGCTTAVVQKRNLAPNETVTIQAEITMPENDGLIRKNILISSNDPNSPSYTLYLSATVKSDFLIEPKKIDIGDIFIGEKKSAKFKLKPINKKPFDPSQIIYSKEIFTVTYKKLDEKNPLSEVEFSVDYFAAPLFMARKAFDTIQIYPYKDSTTLKLDVAFAANVKSYIQVSETSIFRSIEKNKGHTETIHYKHLQNKPFEITSATVSNQKFSTKIIKKTDSEYDVEIILDKSQDIRREDVMLTVTTDQPDGKVLRSYMTISQRRGL